MATHLSAGTCPKVGLSPDTWELASIVFATGFDALTGPLTSIGIRGCDGEELKAKWALGPETYLGACTRGFPNMVMVTGPGSPSARGNMPTSIEQHVDWICGCIRHMRAEGLSRIEPTAEAETYWAAHITEPADATLSPQIDSWYMVANIPGKPRVFLPYIGGSGTYRKLCDEIADTAREGFTFS